MKAKAKKSANRTTQAAIKKRASKQFRGNPDHLARRDLSRLEAEAAELLVPDTDAVIAAGEVIPSDSDQSMKAINLRDTLEHPDQIAHDASADRTALLLDSNLDITALSLDMAATIEADNSLEKGLAHQMALAHTAAFRLISDGLAMVEKAGSQRTIALTQLYSTEGTRLINTGNRMMNTYQQGIATLAKSRRGGKQSMTVKHVTVADGGQAVIGNVEQGASPKTVKK